MEEINVIADYDQFFPLIITKIHIGPDFHILWSSKDSGTKIAFFLDTQIRRKLTLFETCLCLSNTLS